ncbi:MAG: hypothetical protein AB9873_17920 [Syntrophobacteraceae bacterium]
MLDGKFVFIVGAANPCRPLGIDVDQQVSDKRNVFILGAIYSSLQSIVGTGEKSIGTGIDGEVDSLAAESIELAKGVSSLRSVIVPARHDALFPGGKPFP